MLTLRNITALAGLTIGVVFGRAVIAAEPKAQSSESGAETRAAAAIARLLESNTTPGAARPETVKPLYQQAVAVAPRDPRVEYAYSIVLLRIFQPTDARTHLQRALELDPAFAPANQAVIRELIKGRKYTEAGERLSAFAEKLDPSRSDAPQVAEWLGRIVSAVIVAVGTPEAQSQFAYQDRVLRTSLPPALLAAYERGFASVEHELEELTEVIEETRSSATSKREVAKAQADADLKKDQDEIKLKQQDAEKSRKKWDEWITDQTAKADDLLREHEKRFQDLDRAITTQQQAVTSLRLQVDRVERGITSFVQQQQQQQQQRQRRNSNTVFTTPNVNNVETLLAVEERRLANLYDQQAAVSRQASQTLASRQAAVAQYQQATGVALKEEANLDRWEKRNKNIAENMKKEAEKKPTQVATLEAKIKSLNTWDPADFESEKRRMLAELGVTPKESLPATPK